MKPHNLISNQIFSELENLAWNGFDDREEHIVPHQHGEQCDVSLGFYDPHKKTSYRDANKVGMNTIIRRSTSNDVSGRNKGTAFLHPPVDRNSIGVGGLLSYVSKQAVPDSCESECVSNLTTSDSGEGFHFSVDHIPQADALNFLESEHKKRGIDLVHDDWSDVDKFVDDGEMFNNSSIFLEESMHISERVPQFSSPLHAICGLQDTFFSSLQTSCSELSSLNNILEHDGDYSNSCTKTARISSDNGSLSSVIHQSGACLVGTDSEHTKRSTFREQKCDMDTKSTSFCSNDPGRLRTKYINKSSHCSLGFDSLDRTSLGILENKQWDRGYDLLYDNRPEINTFMEDDGQLRNYGSTHRQGVLGTADELSWFLPSAHGICGAQEVPSLSLQSISEFTAFDSTSRPHCPKTSLYPKVSCAVADCGNLPNIGCQSYSSYTSAESKGDSLLDQQVMHIMQMESQNSSHGNSKDRPSECANCNSFDDLNQNFNPYECLEYNLPSHQVLFPSAASSVKSENRSNSSGSCEVSAHVTSYAPTCMEGFSNQFSEITFTKSCVRDQLCGALDAQLSNVQAALTVEASLQETHDTLQQERGLETLLMNTSLGLLASEMDSSELQASSCIASVFSDEMDSFHQLQNVMDQLDFTTKKCIRDALYRLAESAGQRCSFSSTDVSSRMSEVATGTLGIDELKKCMDFIDDEVFRDPLDRSIAQFLFIP